jgi:outer membrane immunogenic protein
MKKLLLSSVALIGLTAAAVAADLPARAAPPAPFAAVPTFTWTGFYVGVNAGWGWRNSDDATVFNLPAGSVINSPTTAGTLTLSATDDDDSGLLGGAQIGYNFQMGAFVFGVEADIQASDLGGDSTTGITGTYVFVGVPGLAFAPPPATVVRGGASIDWFGTVRARAGVAFDRLLVYATGGFAFGGGDNGACAGLIGCENDWNSGWTAGGGVEWAFTNNLTVKLEGLYVDVDAGDNGSAPFFNPVTNTLFLNSADDNSFGIVRAGVNFKF